VSSAKLDIGTWILTETLRLLVERQGQRPEDQPWKAKRLSQPHDGFGVLLKIAGGFKAILFPKKNSLMDYSER